MGIVSINLHGNVARTSGSTSLQVGVSSSFLILFGFWLSMSLKNKKGKKSKKYVNVMKLILKFKKPKG